MSNYLVYINIDEAEMGSIKVLREGASEQIIRLELLGSPMKIGSMPTSGKFTPDGKYLFFGRAERDIEPGLSNIYWVSTEVIENVRPKL